MIKSKLLFVCNTIRYHQLTLLIRNNIFLLAFGVVLGCLIIINPWFILVEIGYGGYLFKRSRLLGTMMIVLVGLLFMGYGLSIHRPLPIKEEYKGIIIEAEEKSTYQRLLIQTGLLKLLIYSKAEETYRVGDQISVSGVVEASSPPHLPGDFDYDAYLKYHHIIGIMSSKQVKKINRPLSIWLIKDALEMYLETCFHSDARAYLYGLLFGDRSGFSEEFEMSLSMNGLVHLFAVSGLHIGLIISIIHSLFKKFKWSHESHFIIIFLGCYCIVTGFAPSIVRATSMFYLALINKKWNLRFSSLDIISGLFIVLILVNPFYIHDIGFCLSFLMATMIILTAPILVKKHPLMQLLIISFMSQMFSLPLIIAMNHEVNSLAFIGNVLFIVLVSSLVIPTALVVVTMFPLQSIFVWMMKAFEWISSLMSQIFIAYQAPSFSVLVITLYYVLLFVIIRYIKCPTKRRWGTALLIGVLLIASMSGHYRLEGRVVFLDCYEGESILISSPYAQTNILIDTGIGKNHEVTDYLLREGILCLDMLIITHEHEDHMGELAYLKRHLRIRQIVTSINSTLLPVTKRVATGDVLTCKEYTFYVLNPSMAYLDENDNSLVLYGVINGRYFLFMGDATSLVEENIPVLPVNILKVGHHGSTTSTSEAFLDRMNPTVAVIQTGQTNRYQFPATSIVKRLEKREIKVYSTSQYFTITYWYQGSSEGFRFQNYPTF
ncbi:MAG: DNA internalization-related competence protein ComEC/Rec2 [Bacilli bacterium]